MTPVQAPPAAQAVVPPRPRASRPGGPLALLGIALLALVVGLSLGRFATFRPGPASGTQQASAVPAQTLGVRLSALERAVADNPRDLGSWQKLGTTAILQAASTRDPAFYALAGRAFDKADGLEPDSPQTLLGRGSLALALHEFDVALAFGQRAARALPNNAQALGILVDANVELGRYEAAAQTLQQMLDLRPDLAALARVSYLRQLHGDLAGAGQAMRQAEIAGSPAAFDMASIAALQGEIALAGGETDVAAEAYGRALRLAPGYEAGEVGMARVEAIQGNLQGAMARLTLLVDRLPTPAAATLLSELQTVAGDAGAAADTDEVVRSVALLQEAQGQIVDLEMALFEADRGDKPQRAVILARRAYRARPDNVFAAGALAWALHKAGDSQAALPFAAQSVRLETADALLRYHAAEVFAAAGERPSARTQLQAALDLTPWFSFAYQAEAGALAQQLGVPVPPVWTQG